MKSFTILLLALSLFVLSCGETKMSDASTTQTNLDTIKIDQVLNESLTTTIKEVLIWYGRNEQKLSQIEIVNNYYGENIDTTKFYSINFDKTEKYLKEFKKSGLFSDKYLESQRTYFKECEKALVADPINDGSPYGLDHDIVLKSQDFDIEEMIRNFKVKDVEVTGEIAKLKADFGKYYSLNFTLSNVSGRWIVDDIQNLNVVDTE